MSATLPRSPKAVARAVADAGRMDVLVNTVEIGSWEWPEGYDLRQVQQMLESDFLAWARTVRAALPQVRQQGDGLLIPVPSAVGRFAMRTELSAARPSTRRRP